MLTPHFNTKEFECKEPHVTGTHKISIELVGCLEALRKTFKKPLRITSGYRTEAYQEKLRGKGIGAAKKSQHTLGNAVDIQPWNKDRVDMAILEGLVADFFLALGFGESFIHVDTRRDTSRQWTYGK